MNEREVNVHITSGTIIKTILFLILVSLLWFLRDIVLIVLSAVVIASAIEPGVHGLMRHKFPRLLAVVSVYVLVIGIFFGILFFFIPPILNDAAGFLTQLPTTLSNLNITDATHGLLPWGNVGDTLSSANIL